MQIVSDRRATIRTTLSKFKVSIYILETYGRFRHASLDHITEIPDVGHSPCFLPLGSYLVLIGWLASSDDQSRADRNLFIQNNPLPEAVVDMESMSLLNIPMTSGLPTTI